MGFTIEFITIFYKGIVLIAPLILLLLMIIIVLSIIVRKIERWKLFEAIYWGFITAFTVGYGDIKPSKVGSRICSVFIALTGIIMSGILVALSVEAATRAYGQYLLSLKP